MSLRPLTKQDLSFVLDWRNSPQVRKSMYSSHKISESEHLAWFERIENEPSSKWYIHENVFGEPDGVVYFSQYKSANHSAFWGFYASPDSSPGTGTHIGLDALNKAFSELNLHKLNAEVLCTNERSLVFHKKLGFTQEGHFRDFHYDGHNYLDVIRFGMLKSEWSQKRSEIELRVASYRAH